MNDNEPRSLLSKEHPAIVSSNNTHCEFHSAGHCLTCSDEVQLAQVLRIDQEEQCALVMIEDSTEEVDISLVETISPGDHLLIHGGVAIGRAD